MHVHFVWICWSNVLAASDDDLNLSYITLMYVHTIDEINGKRDILASNLEPHEHIQTRIEEKMIKQIADVEDGVLNQNIKKSWMLPKNWRDFQPEL